MMGMRHLFQITIRSPASAFSLQGPFSKPAEPEKRKSGITPFPQNVLRHESSYCRRVHDSLGVQTTGKIESFQLRDVSQNGA
jgi:hypothetical protein